MAKLLSVSAQWINQPRRRHFLLYLASAHTSTSASSRTRDGWKIQGVGVLVSILVFCWNANSIFIMTLPKTSPKCKSWPWIYARHVLLLNQSLKTKWNPYSREVFQYYSSISVAKQLYMPDLISKAAAAGILISKQTQGKKFRRIRRRNSLLCFYQSLAFM